MKNIEKNIPELWDKIWEPVSLEEDLFMLKKAENSIQWQRIKKEIIKKFGTFKKLKVIELGAGSATHSLLFSLMGADVYVLDYSEKALQRSKVFFERHNAKVNYLLQDALKLDKNLINKFDVSMSFGTAEHFKGERRIKMIKAHFDVLNEKGVTFIAVPNKWNISYSIWKFLSESFGRWQFGEEYPFSRNEFIKMTKYLNKNYSFLGDSLISSFQFLNPFSRLKGLLGIKQKFDIKRIKKEKGTCLDKYISYSLVLVGTNKFRN